MKSQSGTSVIEVLIALAMVSIIIVSIGNVLSSVHARDTSTANRDRALAYAKESLDMVADIQKVSLFPPAVLPANPLHLALVGSAWQLVAGPESLATAPPFDRREIKVENMWRDVNGNLADPGTGSVDSSTKKITATVFWSEGGKAKQLSLSTVLTKQ